MNLSLALAPRWVSRDAKVISAARGVPSFAQSYIAVLLALYLDLLGFSVLQIGALLSAGVAGGAVFAFLVALIAEKVGRRRLMVTFSLMAAPAGLALLFTDLFLVLAIFACVGGMGVKAQEILSNPSSRSAPQILRPTRSVPTCSLYTASSAGPGLLWALWQLGSPSSFKIP